MSRLRTVLFCILTLFVWNDALADHALTPPMYLGVLVSTCAIINAKPACATYTPNGNAVLGQIGDAICRGHGYAGVSGFPAQGSPPSATSTISTAIIDSTGNFSFSVGPYSRGQIITDIRCYQTKPGDDQALTPPRHNGTLIYNCPMINGKCGSDAGGMA